MQIFWIFAAEEIGGGLLFIISSAVSVAKQDAWLSMLLSGAFSVLVAFMTSKLSQLFPNQTFVEYTQTIVGRFVGTILLVPYFLYWYSAFAMNTRQFSEVISTIILPKSSILEVVIPMMLIVVYLTHQGIEGVGRCSEIIGPLSVGMVILLFLCLLPQVHLQQLRPVLENSPTTIVKGALPSVHFFSECYLMIMLVKFVKKPEAAAQKAMYAVAISSLIITIATVLVICVFGPNVSGKMWYPFFQLVGFISLMGFIQGIDPIIIGIWIFSAFVKLALYCFITSYATAQILGVKKWQRMIWFTAPVAIALSLVPRNISQSDVAYPKLLALPILFPICDVLIPLLLWGIVLLRRRQLLLGKRSPSS